jgi:hypothetical protein
MQYWAIPLQRFYRGRYDPDGRPIRGGITVVAREAELLAVTLKTGIIRKMAGIVSRSRCARSCSAVRQLLLWEDDDPVATSKLPSRTS